MSYIKIAVIDNKPVLYFHCEECGSKYTYEFKNGDNLTENWTNYPYCEVCEAEITQ